ncbi:MAG: nucleoside kinase, partial [Alistipes sp.]|nr:nucleoside kinase [Alistipes sp.]
MMSNTIKIYCENTQGSLFVNAGTTLLQLSEMVAPRTQHEAPVIAGYVNNRLKELDFKIYAPLTVRFIDATHFEGIRVYQRTLFFVLDKAIRDLFPQWVLHIKHAVGKGFYCEIEGRSEISEIELAQITERMKTLIAQNIPIVRERIRCEEALELCHKLHAEDKAELLHTRPHLYVSIYNMADLVGYFYGTLAISTGYVDRFTLHKYYQGFRIATPKRSNPEQIEEMVPQDKMFEVFNEYTERVEIMDVATTGALNAKILKGEGGALIRMAEALQEKSVGQIADQIFTQHTHGGARIIMISGPSSSGKTTFSKRLGVQLSILGMHPVLISLDDYFVNRAHTPRDENGEYDFEALEAVDIPTFNNDLNRLLQGEEVDMPRYNFITGEREYNNHLLKMDERSMLVVEGIHGLNPNLTPMIEPQMKFKIYVSALTTIAMDNLNRISTTDNRLLRRITRDYRTRGNNATSTLQRWESVRRGEDRHIFPNQEQADVMFNSSLFYELSVLKNFVQP